MIVTAKLEREFLFKQNQQEIRLTDPSPKLSPQEVINFYSNTYPVLAIAKIDGREIVGDKIRYTLSTSLGTKG